MPAAKPHSNAHSGSPNHTNLFYAAVICVVACMFWRADTLQQAVSASTAGATNSQVLTTTSSSWIDFVCEADADFCIIPKSTGREPCQDSERALCRELARAIIENGSLLNVQVL